MPGSYAEKFESIDRIRWSDATAPRRNPIHPVARCDADNARAAGIVPDLGRIRPSSGR